MTTIQELLKESDQTVVITHSHADLDSVGAAVGLAATVDGTVDVAIPTNVKSNAEPLLEHCTVVENPELSAYDLQVVVDAPSTERIAPLDPTGNEIPLIVFDHHEPADLQDHATVSYIDTEAPATSILVSEILQAGDWTLSEPSAMALAAGTLDDTDFHGIVLPEVIDDLLDLLNGAGEYRSQLATLWDTETPWGERMATAKAIVRTRGYKAGETILFVTQVGGEETAAAHTLLEANGDLVVVLSERRDEIRVVVRTSDRLEGAHSVPTDVLQPLVDEFGGDAGGHADAGVAKLETTATDAVEDSVVHCIENALGMQFGNFS